MEERTVNFNSISLKWINFILGDNNVFNLLYNEAFCIWLSEANRKQKLIPGAVTVQKFFSHPPPQSHTEILPQSSPCNFHHFYFSVDTHHSGHQVLLVWGAKEPMQPPNVFEKKQKPWSYSTLLLFGHTESLQRKGRWAHSLILGLDLCKNTCGLIANASP